jgi:hypothetical protein
VNHVWTVPLGHPWNPRCSLGSTAPSLAAAAAAAAACRSDQIGGDEELGCQKGGEKGRGEGEELRGVLTFGGECRIWLESGRWWRRRKLGVRRLDGGAGGQAGDAGARGDLGGRRGTKRQGGKERRRWRRVARHAVGRAGENTV